MPLDSPLPYGLGMALAYLFALGASRGSTFYSAYLDSAESKARFLAIEGLRGWLALGVFFHHVVVVRHFYLSREWAPPHSRLYLLLGQVGVALFFVVTGFLFWRKALDLGGRLDVGRYLGARWRRLAPLYFTSVLLVLAIVALRTGFEIRVPPRALLRQVLYWSSFGFLETQDVNGLAGTARINAGVLWTLRYEWLFYLALPPLALLLRPGKPRLFGALFATALLAAWSLSTPPFQPIYLLFLAGMIVAAVSRSERFAPKLEASRFLPWFGLVALAVLFALFDTPYGLPQTFLLALFFLAVAFGDRSLPWLTCRSARLLGTLSYGIYLLHAIALYVVFEALAATQDVAAFSTLAHWGWSYAAGALTLLCALVAFRFVELPFLASRAAAGNPHA